VKLGTARARFVTPTGPGRGAELPLEKFRHGRNTSWAEHECSPKKLHTHNEPSTASSLNLHRPVTRRSPGVYRRHGGGTLIQVRRPVDGGTGHPAAAAPRVARRSRRIGLDTRRRPLPPRSADCGLPPWAADQDSLSSAAPLRRPGRSQRCPTFAASRRLAAPRYPCAAAAQMARSRHRASRGTSRGESPRPSQPPRAVRGRLSTRCCGQLGAGKFGSRCRDDGCSDGWAQALTSRDTSRPRLTRPQSWRVSPKRRSVSSRPLAVSPVRPGCRQWTS